MDVYVTIMICFPAMEMSSNSDSVVSRRKRSSGRKRKIEDHDKSHVILSDSPEISSAIGLSTSFYDSFDKKGIVSHLEVESSVVLEVRQYLKCCLCIYLHVVIMPKAVRANE